MKSRESRLFHAVVLLVLQAFFSLGLSWLMYLTPLSTAHCTDLCDYATVAVAVNTLFVIALLVFVISIFGILILRHYGWWVIAPPAIALPVVIVAFIVAT